MYVHVIYRFYIFLFYLFKYNVYLTFMRNTFLFNHYLTTVFFIFLYLSAVLLFKLCKMLPILNAFAVALVILERGEKGGVVFFIVLRFPLGWA